MKFGPEIKVDGVKPEWLGDEEKFGWKRSDGEWTSLNDWTAKERMMRWDDAVAIRLPADHPHYNLITHTYTVRPEDEAALLASDPLLRSTPDERAVAPELVARLVELARSVSTSPECTIAQTVEAQNILAALEPVDEDLVAAREVVVELEGRPFYSWEIRDGKHDGDNLVKVALAAIKRGRLLQREEDDAERNRFESECG